MRLQTLTYFPSSALEMPPSLEIWRYQRYRHAFFRVP
jgi:hypothetical protein